VESLQLLQSHLKHIHNELQAHAAQVPSLHDKELQMSMERIERRLERPCFTIGVMGPRNSGKSTLVNALLGEDLLPAGEDLLAAATTHIVFGAHDGTVITYRENGQTEQITELPLSHAFYEDMRLGKSMQYQLFHKPAALASWDAYEHIDWVIVDLPGEQSYEADLVLYVLDITSDITTELQRLEPDIKERAVFILNKADLVSDPYVQQTQWQQELGRDVYVVSAQTSLYEQLVQAGGDAAPFYQRTLKERGEVATLVRAGLRQLEDEVIVPVFLNLQHEAERALQSMMLKQSQRVAALCEQDTAQLQKQIEMKKENQMAAALKKQALHTLLQQHEETKERIRNEIEATAAVCQMDETEKFPPFLMNPFPYHTESDEFEEKEAAYEEGEQRLRQWLNEQPQLDVSASYKEGMHYEPSSYNYFAMLNELARKELKALNEHVYAYSQKYPKTITYMEMPQDVTPQPIRVNEEPMHYDSYAKAISVSAYEVPYTDRVWLVFQKTKYMTLYKYSLQSAVQMAERELTKRYYSYAKQYHEAYMTEKYNRFAGRVIERALHVVTNSQQHVQQLLFRTKKELDTLQQQIDALNEQIACTKALKKRILYKTMIVTHAREVAATDDLASLIEASQPGTTFLLGEGEYIIDRPVLLQSAAFIGQGTTCTTLRIEKSVLQGHSYDSFRFEQMALIFTEPFQMDGHFLFASHCSFQNARIYTGDNTELVLQRCSWKEGMLEVSGSYHMTDCELQDTAVSLIKAASGDMHRNKWQNSSLTCEQQAYAQLSYNEMLGERSGIMVRDNSRLEMKGARISQAVCAVTLMHQAVAICKENLFHASKNGIRALDVATVTVENNRFEGNTVGLYAASNIDVFRGNHIENNHTGVHIASGEIGDFSNNIFTENIIGLQVTGEGNGTIEHNTFSEQRESGVMLEGHAQIWLVNNRCEKQHTGIVCKEAAVAVLVNNTIEENEIGVCLRDEASVEVKHNFFNSNRQCGMAITGHVTGSVIANHYRNNGLSFSVDTAKIMEFADNKQTEQGFAVLKPQYWQAKMKVRRSTSKAKKQKQR
jgi:ribosome biogenesis GTPase A